MVLIHIQVAFGTQLQIETAMLREQLEHVIEKADSGRNFVAAVAFDLQTGRDARLFCVALQGRPSHSVNTSSR